MQSVTGVPHPLLALLQSSIRSYSFRRRYRSGTWKIVVLQQYCGGLEPSCPRHYTPHSGDQGLRIWNSKPLRSRHYGQSEMTTSSRALDTLTVSGSCENLQERAGNRPASKSTWNLISCNAAISRSAQQGCSAKAFALFFRMQDEHIRPNRITFLSLLKAFTSPVDLEGGKRAHSLIVEARLESDVRIGTALVCMYFKCKSTRDAHQVFCTLQTRDLILWNAMIEGYCKNGLRDEALDLFRRMESEGVGQDKATFTSILKTCNSAKYLEEGKQLHEDIMRLGFESDIYLQTALVSMYCKCGSLSDARQVFDRSRRQDVVLWTTLISGYAQRGHTEESFDLFRLMRQAGARPNMMTFITLLKACGRPEMLQRGKWLHGHIVQAGLELDEKVGTALISMYCKCQSLVDAQKAFNKLPKRNVISWTALISGFARNGREEEALELFNQMQQEGLKPNQVTMSNIVNICARLRAV